MCRFCLRPEDDEEPLFLAAFSTFHVAEHLLPDNGCNHFLQFSSGWWFQTFFMFIPIWGNDPIWRSYFSDGLKPLSSLLLSHHIPPVFFRRLRTMENFKTCKTWPQLKVGYGGSWEVFWTRLECPWSSSRRLGMVSKRHPPEKTNSSSLKMDGWNTTFLLGYNSQGKTWYLKLFCCFLMDQWFLKDLGSLVRRCWIAVHIRIKKCVHYTHILRTHVPTKTKKTFLPAKDMVLAILSTSRALQCVWLSTEKPPRLPIKT